MMIAEQWESGGGLPDSVSAILAATGFDDPELLLAVPEWKTSLPDGYKPTQTDVFALVRCESGVIALCIEAKVRESFGKLIGQWLQETSAAGVKRLDDLLQIIGAIESPPHHLRYQLVHRTAAACIEAERFNAAAALMVVQSFSNQEAGFKDFAEFFGWLGVNDVRPGELFQVPVKRGIPLYVGWISEGGGDD